MCTSMKMLLVMQTRTRRHLYVLYWSTYLAKDNIFQKVMITSPAAHALQVRRGNSEGACGQGS